MPASVRNVSSALLVEDSPDVPLDLAGGPDIISRELRRATLRCERGSDTPRKRRSLDPPAVGGPYRDFAVHEILHRFKGGRLSHEVREMRSFGERDRAVPDEGETIVHADEQASDAGRSIHKMHGACADGSSRVAPPMLDIGDVVTRLHKRIALPSHSAPIGTDALRLIVDGAKPLKVVGLPDKDPAEAFLPGQQRRLAGRQVAEKRRPNGVQQRGLPQIAKARGPCTQVTSVVRSCQPSSS